MIVGDDREGLEAISGGEDLATGFLSKVSAVRRIVLLSSITMTFQATNFYCVVAAHIAPVCKIHLQSAARH